MMAESNVPQSEDLATRSEEAVGDETEKTSFNRRLITQVRRYQIIYDDTHKYFSNAAKKAMAWQEIARKLNSDADTCESKWIELRNMYECYVQSLRTLFHNNPKVNCRRASMDLDSDLICLFKFINNTKNSPTPPPPPAPDLVQPVKGKESSSLDADDDLILIEEPTELIVINEDIDDNRNTKGLFKVTEEMKTLVEHIMRYPELYDSTNTDYTNYSRKSYIWNSIAMEIGDKATKLMKCWILMITHYEWELSRNLHNKSVAAYQTDLQRLLKFFDPYILANPDTVYKHSFYLKQSWHEPIFYLKEVFQLIVRMKKIPQVVTITDSLLKIPQKNKQFFNAWAEVARLKGNSVGQCETTWLIMRSFYWELKKMRANNYQLNDKWFFETVIAELYDLAKETQAIQKVKELKRPEKPCIKRTVATKKRRVQNTVDSPLGNVEENNTNNSIVVVAENETFVVTMKSEPNPTEHPPFSEVTSMAEIKAEPKSEQLPLPKITSAISLAPKHQPTVTLNGCLQIRPIGPHSSIVKSPPPESLAKSLPRIQLPPRLPNKTKISTIIKASPVPMPRNNTPQIASNAKTAKCSIFETKGYSSPRTATPSIPPNVTIKPIIRLNSSTTVSSVVPLSLGSPQTSSSKGVSSTVTSPSSPLNLKEIKIELISSSKGSYLLVDYPPANEKYHLPTEKMEKFIRDVLAIPLLHNGHNKDQPNATNCNLMDYWHQISKRFKLPPHICQACWHFFEDKFSQIVPLKELIKPFSNTLFFWKQSHELFDRFDQHAISNGWLDYISYLPEIVDRIGKYPALYKDVAKNATGPTSDAQALRLMCSISSRYPNVDHINTIWSSFKNVFCQYMTDIEIGVDNKWHSNWWRVLARLKFLVETRYSTNEPFYYIVTNKMMEEIKRCALYK